MVLRIGFTLLLVAATATSGYAASSLTGSFLGSWTCKIDNLTFFGSPSPSDKQYAAQRYALVFLPNGKGRFRAYRFGYRINDVSRYGKDYVGVLHVSGAMQGTRYIIDATSDTLDLTSPEWWSSQDNAYYPVPDAETYKCRRVR